MTLPVNHDGHSPEQTTLYRRLQQNAATVLEEAESIAGVCLPQFVKDEFYAFLCRGNLAHGFPHLRAASSAWAGWTSRSRRGSEQGQKDVTPHSP